MTRAFEWVKKALITAAILGFLYFKGPMAGQFILDTGWHLETDAGRQGDRYHIQIKKAEQESTELPIHERRTVCRYHLDGEVLILLAARAPIQMENRQRSPEMGQDHGTQGHDPRKMAGYAE